MPSLRRDTRLRRASSLNLTLRGEGEVVIHVQGQAIACGPLSLVVLSAFASERTIQEALDALGDQGRGPAQWMEAAASIDRLVAAGALLMLGSEGVQLGDVGWEEPSRHISMLDDEVRTARYLEAIRATVRPTDVVVEIGTGTGVLALAAAKAGARHVFAIEASRIADAAQLMFEASELRERITLVRDWSTHVSLPERGTLLVSEILGSEPLDEGVLHHFRDARARLLQPDARSIPGRLRVFAYPATVDEGFYERHAFATRTTARWSKRYALDFDPLKGFARGGRILVAHDEVARWTPLASPTELVDVDLSGDPIVDAVEHRIHIHTSGVANALVMYFSAELSAGVTLTTEPTAATFPRSWRNAVWFRPDGLDVHAGKSAVLRYDRARGPAALTLDDDGHEP